MYRVVKVLQMFPRNTDQQYVFLVLSLIKKYYDLQGTGFGKSIQGFPTRLRVGYYPSFKLK
jgi:hypothetical protein